MRKKTKFDYEIENFEHAFREKKEQRIVIYGIGRMTATLLERISGYNIIGLLDRDENLIGRYMYGFKILNREEAEKNADLLIINTTETYWNVIYNRIKDWDIPIYFRNGQLAKDKLISEFTDMEYWDKSYSDLEQAIMSYDVVSFDIFDTLVMRKVLFPIDVLSLTELKIRRHLGTDIEFVLYRKKAAALLNEPTIDEIYKTMQQLMGCSKKTCDIMKEFEMESELCVLVPREDIVRCCKNVMKKKNIYFISDMYYSSEFIKKILLKVGINVHLSQILVSCEYKKSKLSGELWTYYKNYIIGNRKAIHVGDNKKSDCEMPEREGIDSFYLMSAADMLKYSSIHIALPQAITMYASAALGLIVAKVFNSPFALYSTKGMVHFKTAEDAGYCLLGGVVYSFLLWLLRQTSRDGVEELLFFAREGYFLTEEYKYMQELLNGIGPKGTYLEISRRAIMGASTTQKEDVYNLARFPYDGDLQDFLYDRFHVEVEKEELKGVLISSIQKDEEKLEKLLNKYMNDIYNNLQQERIGYQKYFNSLGVRENYAVVDSMLYGNTQYYLGKFLGQRTKGYYFTVCLDCSNQCKMNSDMKGCFQKESDIFGRDAAVFRYAMFIEAFFTSPKGMLICINQDGKKIYAQKMTNQKKYDIRYDMQKGILNFLNDMLILQEEKNIEKLFADEQYADFLFGCFMDHGFEALPEMKESFYYDNGLLNHKEVAIWE